MKRRLLGLALAMSMIAAMTACNGGGKETTAPETTAPETTSEAAQQESESAEKTVGSALEGLPDYDAADFLTFDGYKGMEVQVEDKTVTD